MFSAISLLIKNEGTECWRYFHACALAVKLLDSKYNTQLFFATALKNIFIELSTAYSVNKKQVLIYLLRLLINL